MDDLLALIKRLQEQATENETRHKIIEQDLSRMYKDILALQRKLQNVHK